MPEVTSKVDSLPKAADKVIASSQPSTKSVLLEKAIQERDFWKEGWYEQRQATGKACWDEYYRGILIALKLSPHWTTRMYMLAGRIKVLLSIYKNGNQILPQLDPRHKTQIIREIHSLLNEEM